MEILDIQQGSEAWHQARAAHFCASDAPAVMGASKYKSRAEFVRSVALGITEEIDAHKQALFDRGHAAEDAARAFVEESIGEDLYPVVGVSGRFLASFDGLTMDGRTGYEHKLWNEDLAAQVRSGQLEPHYYWQLEHQILVGGLDRVVFVCSDGTQDRFAQCEYRPVPGRAEQLRAAWEQFAGDVAAYQHVEVAPKAVVIEATLPALSIRVDGALALTSNLGAFGAQLRDFVERMPTKPETDEDFAACESAVKTLEKAEQALKTAEDAALAQTASVEEMRRTVAQYREFARTNRLMVEKLVKARKEAIRGEIVQEGKDAFAAHLAGLNARLGKAYMPAIVADFSGVVKGKRTVQSLRDAVSDELARAKLSANEIADRIQVNLSTLRDLAADHSFLFADTAQIVLKANDDLTALVKNRIAEHAADEARKAEAIRIKAEADARAAIEREQREEAERKAAAERANQAIQRAAAEAPSVDKSAQMQGPAVDKLPIPQGTAHRPGFEVDHPATIETLRLRIVATLGTLNEAGLREVLELVEELAAA